MLGEGGKALSRLREAVREFQASEDRELDLKGLREVIDGLKHKRFFQEWTSPNRVVRVVDLLERDRS